MYYQQYYIQSVNVSTIMRHDRIQKSIAAYRCGFISHIPARLDFIQSVSKTVVACMLVAKDIADYCDDETSKVDIYIDMIEGFIAQERKKLETLLTHKNGEDAYDLRESMEKILMDKVWVFRNESDLQSAVDELEQLLIRSNNIEVKGPKSRASNPALVNAYRVQRMLKIAITVAYGALLRKENRGAHSREDYQERNDKD